MPTPTNTSELNVVIVDDHVALRRGMELLLRRAGHHVVGTADDAEAGEALILRRRPDIALVDLALPGKSGAAMTRSLLAEDPKLRIILYTGAADESQLLDALDAGAAGFALKSGDPEELEQAILTVAGGGDYLDPRLTPLLAQGAERTAEDAVPARARDHGPALAGPVGRGGSEAAVPLVRDRPHARAQRHDEARRRHPRARRRAGHPARRDRPQLARGGVLPRLDVCPIGVCPTRSGLKIGVPQVDNRVQTVKGKPVVRRGRKARGLCMDVEAAQLPDQSRRNESSNV